MAVMPQRSKKISLQISAHTFLIWKKKKTLLQRQSPAAVVPSFFKVRKNDLFLEFSLYEYFLLMPHLVNEDLHQNSSTKGGKKK